jgi:septum formation protein
LRFVLASGSPTRRRVLEDAGLHPVVAVSGADEQTDGLDTETAVVELAERKLTAVAGDVSDAMVLGCDTMLDLDGEALGKPASPEDAIGVWRRLSGRSATLFTGHCLLDTTTGRRISETAGTVVHFGEPSQSEIAAYVATGEPMAMAGSFSIEGRGAPFVLGIEGDVTNVLGVSLPLLRAMLAELGFTMADLAREPPAPVIRDLAEADRDWLRDLVAAEWGLPVVSTSGCHDPGALPGLVAVSEDGGQRCGALTYRESTDGIEVVTLNSLVGGRGIGTALLREARRRADEVGRRMFLITTNENMRAIAFYQRRGMDMVALHRDFASVVGQFKPRALDSARHGIGFRHAIEFEYPPHAAADSNK